MKCGARNNLATYNKFLCECRVAVTRRRMLSCAGHWLCLDENASNILRLCHHGDYSKPGLYGRGLRSCSSSSDTLDEVEARLTFIINTIYSYTTFALRI